MRPLPTAFAAVLAGTIGLAVMPSVQAQDIEPAHYRMGPAHSRHMQPDREHFGARGDRAGGPLAGLMCTEDGAGRLEAVLDRVAERLGLGDTQTPLFEDFRTASLTAQTTFADACMAVHDETPDDLVQAIRARQALLAARLEAVDSVLPSFEALYDSLTDAQKLALVRMRPGAPHGFGPNHERWHGREGPEELR